MSIAIVMNEGSAAVMSERDVTGRARDLALLPGAVLGFELINMCFRSSQPCDLRT